MCGPIGPGWRGSPRSPSQPDGADEYERRSHLGLRREAHVVGAPTRWSAGRVRVKRCRKRAGRSKAKADAEELGPEIVQVIAVVAEIMLEQRRRQPTEGNSSPEAA